VSLTKSDLCSHVELIELMTKTLRLVFFWANILKTPESGTVKFLVRQGSIIMKLNYIIIQTLFKREGQNLEPFCFVYLFTAKLHLLSIIQSLFTVR
jgi:hypothetical protein